MNKNVDSAAFQRHVGEVYALVGTASSVGAFCLGMLTQAALAAGEFPTREVLQQAAAVNDFPAVMALIQALRQRVKVSP